MSQSDSRHITKISMTSALAITPSHQQNTHDFAYGHKNMNDIFNNYVFQCVPYAFRTPFSKCLARALDIMQNCGISSAKALEILVPQSCTKPLIYSYSYRLANFEFLTIEFLILLKLYVYITYGLVQD